jgi:hypothetical protein
VKLWNSKKKERKSLSMNILPIIEEGKKKKDKGEKKLRLTQFDYVL